MTRGLELGNRSLLKGAARSSGHGCDRDLIVACIAGRQDAWNTLVERYGRLVYSIPRRYGLNEADSDDVHAAVWGIVFKHLSALKDQTRFSSWLITTAHRECWRVAKNREANLELTSQMAGPSEPSEEEASRWERQHAIREGLIELGGKCRDLLEALYLARTQLSYDAIGEQLNMKPGSIGPTRARCLEKLERILLAKGNDFDRIC